MPTAAQVSNALGLLCLCSLVPLVGSSSLVRLRWSEQLGALDKPPVLPDCPSALTYRPESHPDASTPCELSAGAAQCLGTSITLVTLSASSQAHPDPPWEGASNLWGSWRGANGGLASCGQGKGVLWQGWDTLRRGEEPGDEVRYKLGGTE